MHTFEINMDPPLARRAWNSRYRTKVPSWVLTALLLPLVVWMDLHDGDLDTVLLVLLSMFGVTVALFIVGYVMGLRAFLAMAESGTCAYTLTDSTISLADSQISTVLNWTAIAGVHNLNDFVNVTVRGGGTVTLPVSQIPAEALTFLVERSQASGARLTGF